MKKILLLVHSAQKKPDHMNWFAFRDKVQARLPGDIRLSMAALNGLTFVLDGDETMISDTAQGFTLADFDLVVFRTIGKCLDEAIAVAAFCRKKNIRYIDEYIPQIGNQKLSCAFVRWEHGLSVPRTAYGPDDAMTSDAVVERIGLPAIVKANDGRKGRDNHLAADVTEIKSIVGSSDMSFVMQEYISNAGDYRVLVLDGVARLIIWRTSSAGSHLNNTSQGGSATLLELDDAPDGMVALAERAAALERLTVAGVDIILDKHTNKPYILEVNRAPQIATGGEAEAKVDAYAILLKELIGG